MVKTLQITALLLLTAVFFVSLPFTWLGIWPELDFFSYLSNWQIYGTFLSTIAIYTAVIAYIFGWNPQTQSLAWIRKNIIIPVLNKVSSLSFLVVLLIITLFFQAKFIYSFKNPYAEEIVSMIWAENYAGADRLIGQKSLPSSDIAQLFFVNDSIRQQFYSTSQNADKELCRIYSNYFSSRSLFFHNVWFQYLVNYAHASCMQVLENPKESIKLYNKALRLARWINPDEEKRTARKIATIYFYDSNGVAGIKNKEERLRKIIELVSTDANPTAQRMLGASYYMLGEYAKAVETWNDLLGSLGSDEILEKKKILNNMSLAYSAQFQYSLALNKANEGISLPFNTNNEKERRGQIRLLSTKTQTLLAQEKCSEALDVWNYRNTLRQQQLSKCTSLISTQVLSCNGGIGHEKKLLKSLLIGVGQDPDSFIDFTKPAIVSLVEQANTIFSGCYLGLTYPKQKVLSAVERLISSGQSNSLDH